MQQLKKSEIKSVNKLMGHPVGGLSVKECNKSVKNIGNDMSVMLQIINLAKCCGKCLKFVWLSAQEIKA